MAGFFSNESLSPNAFEIEKQRLKKLGQPLIDFTSSNPSSAGLLFPSEKLIEWASEYLGNRRYTPMPKGIRSAREAISQYYLKKSPSLDISPEHIFITASTSEGYGLLFALLCDPHDNVLLPQVTYPLFDLFAAEYHVDIHLYKNDIEQDGWSPQPSSFKAIADKKSRAIFFVSPHNPTGHIIRERCEEVVSLGLPIVADEVFSEFIFDGGDCPSLGLLYPELPVFHLNGISKLVGLPDLKLGWLALNDVAYKMYGQRLELLNDLYLGANQLTQSILPKLLTEGLEFTHFLRTTYQANLQQMISSLSNCQSFNLTMPSGGAFLFPKIEGVQDEEELVLGLLKAGVIVHPGYFYGAESSDSAHLMLSCVIDTDSLSRGLDIVKQFCGSGV